MGIKVDINTDYNVQAGFWKVVSSNFSVGSGRYEIVVSGWKNKASFQARYLPLKRFTYFSDVELQSKAAMEAFVLAQPEFAGAANEPE